VKTPAPSHLVMERRAKFIRTSAYGLWVGRISRPDREGQVIVIAGQHLLVLGKRQGCHRRRRRPFRTEN
jgi:hypothetical protein